jgi:DNA-binding MarR family transcriptional regulator
MIHLTLKESIHQSRPFASVQAEALLTLMWAGDRAARVTNEPLRTLDLSSAQYNVLRILRGSPEGLQTTEVVDRMVTRAPNITRLVDKLETRGFIERRRCSEDRRVVYLQITPAGLGFIEEISPELDAATRSATRGLSEEEHKTLIHLLNKLGGAAEPIPGNPITEHQPMEKSS